MRVGRWVDWEWVGGEWGRGENSLTHLCAWSNFRNHLKPAPIITATGTIYLCIRH